MQAYSTPMTPPPTTISVLGISGMARIWSLLMMVRPLSGNGGRVGRLGAGGDDDDGRFEVGLAARVLDADVGGVEEAGAAVDHFDAVARQLRLGDIDFGLDHLVDAEAQVGHGDLFLDVVIDAVDALKLEAGEMQHGFAHGLAGDGAGVDAGAADDFALLDDDHAAAALGALNGGALPGGAGADHDEVVVAHAGGDGVIRRRDAETRRTRGWPVHPAYERHRSRPAWLRVSASDAGSTTCRR